MPPPSMAIPEDFVTSTVAIIAALTLELISQAHLLISLESQISLLLFGAACMITTAIIGRLRYKVSDILRWERQQHAPAHRLAMALDRLPSGIVLLDRDTRAEFINRAFRNLFALPDSLADRKPPLIALLYHCRDTHAYAVPDDELNHFIKRFTSLTRSGDFKLDFALANGETLRVICTALPDGGRMLTYTPITDLIRKDDPQHYSAPIQPQQPEDIASARAASVQFFNKDHRPLSQS